MVKIDRTGERQIFSRCIKDLRRLTISRKRVDVLDVLNFHHRVLNSKPDLDTFAEKFSVFDSYAAHHPCHDNQATFAYTQCQLAQGGFS